MTLKKCTQKIIIDSCLPNRASVVLHGVQIVTGSDIKKYAKRKLKLILDFFTSEIHTQLEINSSWDEFLGFHRQPEAKTRNCLYLRAQTELGELLSISRHKTSATMRLQLVLDHENAIWRSRIDIFGKYRRKFYANL